MAFREARAAKIGGKFLAYGNTGSGKSFFQLTFPKVACEDSEAGVAHYEGRPIKLNNGNTYNNLIMVDNTADLDELEDGLDLLLSGEYDNKIETFSIDSETKFYATMQVGATEVEERKARKKGGDIDDTVVSQRQWGRIKIINMKLQQAKIDLSARGIHVVSVAQATDVFEGTGDNRKFVGIKPDMHKSVKFDYDTILEFYTEEEKDGSLKYFAKVKKDRTEVTKVGQIIENPCFDIWAGYYNSRNKLDTNKTSYKKDIKTSTESMIDEADKAETIVAEWKSLMKQLKDSGKSDCAMKVSKLLKEKELDIKKLDSYSVDDLTELLDFTKLQLN